LLALSALLLAAPRGFAQQGSPQTAPPDRRVDLDFLRYYTAEQLQVALQSLASAYPELISLESIGQSRGGRELWVATLSSRSASARMSCRPVSALIGRDSSRTNFMPL